MSVIGLQGARDLNTIYANGERMLDVAGYIPVVSVVGALVRSSLALAQLVHGLALGLFALISHAIHRNVDEEHPAQVLMREAGYLFLNSFFNFLRAKVEVIPFFGGMTCLSFDFLKSGLSRDQLGFIYGDDLADANLHRPLIGEILR